MKLNSIQELNKNDVSCICGGGLATGVGGIIDDAVGGVFRFRTKYPRLSGTVEGVLFVTVVMKIFPIQTLTVLRIAKSLPDNYIMD